MSKLSATNLSEAIHQAHEAVRLSGAPAKSQEEKNDALRNAAARLCEELRVAVSDDDYWAALAAGTPHPQKPTLAKLLEDLAADKDNRRTELADLYRRIGYKPKDEADEVVRGLVQTAYAGAVLGIGGSSANHAGRSASVVTALGKEALDRFSHQFCAAEKYFVKSYAKAGTEKTKAAVNSGFKTVVTSAAATAAIVLLGFAMPEVAQRMPDKDRQVICTWSEKAPDTLKPVLRESFCALRAPAPEHEEEAQLNAMRHERLDELRKHISELETQIQRTSDDSKALEVANQRLLLAKQVEEQIAKLKAKSSNKFRM